ncbi:type VII toxin-antitoxin system HepT family RNase toxin [Nitrospira moscoviensis]|uniref:DUF86 domain-containing protein n=1 Tax=Nitrospira moscoviensis TaxID=42253 RepID=A0A0K2GEW4_NITMO|nr:DUF86 domain-containing protein [Nitrospira moscoviensis]ALA59152.1 hypothetical protein NITMOv2_2742 [Nitrospira moscoviensis]
MTPADPAVVRRKLSLIVNNLQSLESVRHIAPARYREDLFLRKGTERLLQETIEAAIDINTHLLVRGGYAPPDDYFRGFLLLAEQGILSPELAVSLAPSAGLRNRLVHEYDDLVDAIVLDAVTKLLHLYPQYVAAIERHCRSLTPPI